MEKIPIRVLVECPGHFYMEQELELCHSCDYFEGLEYIDNGFKNVVCSYDSLGDEGEGEKNETNLDQ